MRDVEDVDFIIGFAGYGCVFLLFLIPEDVSKIHLASVVSCVWIHKPVTQYTTSLHVVCVDYIYRGKFSRVSLGFVISDLTGGTHLC